MTLLENFYYGNVTPNVMIPDTDPELRKTASKLEHELRGRLSDEDKDLFIRYVNKELSVHSDGMKENFLFGFRFGTLMMMEVFQQSEDLMGEE